MMPKDPSKFKGDFSYYYIEDENGEIPKCYEGTISHIPLECIVEDNIVKLHGRTSVYKTKCFDLKINNHNYGMMFLVSCNNINTNVKDKIIWRRAIDKNLLHNLFDKNDNSKDMEVNILLEGDAPEVPNCPISIAIIKLVKDRRDYHIINVLIEITLDVYDLFIQRYSE